MGAAVGVSEAIGLGVGVEVFVGAIGARVISGCAVSANSIVEGAADDASSDGAPQALNAIKTSSPKARILMRAIILHALTNRQRAPYLVWAAGIPPGDHPRERTYSGRSGLKPSPNASYASPMTTKACGSASCTIALIGLTSARLTAHNKI